MHAYCLLYCIAAAVVIVPGAEIGSECLDESSPSNLYSLKTPPLPIQGKLPRRSYMYSVDIFVMAWFDLYADDTLTQKPDSDEDQRVGAAREDLGELPYLKPTKFPQENGALVCFGWRCLVSAIMCAESSITMSLSFSLRFH